ncbi:hypothetical protein [Brevibacillus daliensis]|uniref:hypothetical protein n=1 Tax=Brevibacillus daliensis TaxID=2892995 RepID=UPI001E3F1BF3|nr:hypothetical protein [Brevibacillus daliensis]
MGIAMFPIIGFLILSFILFYYLYKGIAKDTTKHDREFVWVEQDTTFMDPDKPAPRKMT